MCSDAYDCRLCKFAFEFKHKLKASARRILVRQVFFAGISNVPLVIAIDVYEEFWRFLVCLYKYKSLYFVVSAFFYDAKDVVHWMRPGLCVLFQVFLIKLFWMLFWCSVMLLASSESSSRLVFFIVAQCRGLLWISASSNGIFWVVKKSGNWNAGTFLLFNYRIFIR